MRLSVQLRAAVTPSIDDRWQRSVYVGTEDHELTVYFDDMSPVGVTQTDRPPLEGVHSIVFVVDTTNTRPGASGRVWFSGVSLAR
jgi:hypothetical protein